MPPLDTGESILLEAQRLTHGDRNVTYGHPLDDYGRTSDLWNALLRHKLSEPITPEEAALCMCAVKLSRHVHAPKRDNMVDLAGYAWVAWACTEERERREAVMCIDEGCPHYGTPHEHVQPAPLGAGPLEPEPEGFPSGYAAPCLEELQVQSDAELPRSQLPFLGHCGEGYCMGERIPYSPYCAVHADMVRLPCGCVKRCKGHSATTTADAEFPAAPSVHPLA